VTRSSCRRPGLGLAFAAILALSTTAFAQPAPADYTDETAMPAGRRGERIRQVLDAVNSGDRVHIEALVKAAFGGSFRDIPLGDHLDALGGLHDQSQGLEFHATTASRCASTASSTWAR
jgi:hypothetical protein